jgi:multiple sugar transport system substrate-binding protein
MQAGRRRLMVALAWLALMPLTGCDVSQQQPNEIVLQRFFGSCRAEFGKTLDVTAAEDECGIITTLINRFNAQNPDISVRVRTIAWPGYNQLSAQIATNDAPDLVTMHMSAISDFESRQLLEPMGEVLGRAGVDIESLTTAAKSGVTRAGQIYGLPFDTWAPLWHINLNYFRQAGLVRDGEPVLPSSPEELLEHARQFREATGKPYFVQALVNERGLDTRNLYTYLMQQDAVFFPDVHHIHLKTEAARRAVALFKAIFDEGLTTKNQDYAAATRGFIDGDGGVYLVGTWLISQFEMESARPGRPLSNGYTVATYPQLYARDVSFVDGHAWVMPKRTRTPTQRRAVERLLKFLADNNFEWSRVGHLPAFETVVNSPRFLALPHRRKIAKLTTIGEPLPSNIQRQFAIQDIVGEEVASAIAGQKPIDVALADAERRVNDLLSHVL